MEEKQIAKNIKKIRVNRKRSVERLSKLSGLTKEYVSKIGNSDKSPPFSTSTRLAKALNTDIGIFNCRRSEMPERIGSFRFKGKREKGGRIKRNAFQIAF